MKTLISIVLFITSSFAFANNGQQGIEVSGKAAIMAPADLFTLTVQIKERASVAQKAKIVVDNKSQKIVQMLKRKGIEDKQITSSQLTIYPRYQQVSIKLDNAYIKSKNSLQKTSSQPDKKQTQLYFDVTRTISVNFKKEQDYDVLLDAIVKFGVTNVSPLQKSVSNSEALYQQALTLAIKNAQSKASEISKQLGIKLGNVISLKESSYNPPVRYRAAAQFESGLQDNFRSNFGEESISAQVIATFAIKQ